MSLLWIQAAWHDEKPGIDERHIRHVQDAHGVDRETALHALQHVTRGLHAGEPYGSPTSYGFASVPSPDRPRHVPEEAFSGIWKHTPVQDVSLASPLHASQTGIDHQKIAHNLFHPGKRAAPEWDEDNVKHTGHPDIEPEPWDEEDADDADFDNYGPSDAARMIRQTDGSHVVTDGHHRVAADLLLGKSTTRARVLDVRHLSGKTWAT